jgi:hypothetical protein
VGVVSSLIYYLFTLEKRVFRATSRWVGRIVMMVAFGAAFGNTVMARVSLFLVRMQFSACTGWV